MTEVSTQPQFDQAEPQQALSYAERMKLKAEQSAQAHEQKKAPEAAERRAAAIAQGYNQGVEFFRTGINSVRERLSGVGEKAKEVGIAILGSPEWVVDQVNAGVDTVKRVAAEGALRIDRVNDACADKWDELTAKGTGAVEAGWRNTVAGVTEGGARFAAWRKEANAKRKEKGHLVLRTALEAARALVRQLEANLDGAREEDQRKVEDWEESRADMMDTSAELRQEAAKRKDNGQSLAGFRSWMSKTIAPTRF